MMSSHMSYTAVVQRSWKDNFTVFLLRQLRPKTLTAEEATKNSHPRAGPGLVFLLGLCVTQPGSAR